MAHHGAWSQVRVAGLGLLALLAWASVPPRPVRAESQPVRIRTAPPGAQIIENGAPVAVAGGPTEAALQLTADTSVPHSYVIRRAGFDDLPLTLRWDPGVTPPAWACVGNQAAMIHYLQADEVVHLPKTFTLRCEPEDSVIYREVQGDTYTLTTNTFGSTHHWRVVERDREGCITLPDPCGQPTLLIRHALFADALQAIPPDALLEASAYPSSPIHLQPLYGPFSYRTFDAALGVLGLLALAGWQLWWRPRKQLQLQEVERKLAIADAVEAPVEVGEVVGSTDNRLVGSTLITDTQQGFVLLRELGRGAAGAVFEACGDGRERSVDERWAVKLLFAEVVDEQGSERYKREVAICSTLNHPGIVKVFDSGVFKSRPDAPPAPFIVMELVPGVTLESVMEQAKGPLAPSRALTYLRDLLLAMRAAHRAGVIHRDLKPGNCMVTPAGHVKILDFGLAQAKKSAKELTKTGTGMGTPRYMSPEHLDAKRVTPAADVFSLGVITYEMLSGRSPFEGDDVWTLITQMMTTQARPLTELCPDLTPALSDYVARMLETDVETRFADAGEALAELDARRAELLGE